jgi:tRNA(Ile2) C34 agmatinyltransferase TiaS
MLDEVLVGVWEGLTAHRVAQCPVCGGEMEPEYGVHSRPFGGQCKRCGTTLR